MPGALPGALGQPLPGRPLSCAPAGGAPGPVTGGGPGDAGLGAIGTSGTGQGPAPGELVTAVLRDLLARTPCAGPTPGPGEPAGLPAPAPGQSAGNPVDLITGNKYARAVDVSLPDPESGLAEALLVALGADAARALGDAWQPFEPLRFMFSRHYNSRFEGAGPLGPGWRHGFETALARLPGREGVVLQVVQADGRRLVFRRPVIGRAAPSLPAFQQAQEEGLPPEPGSEGLRFEGVAAHSGEIVERLGAPLPWVWRWPDGRTLGFDTRGRLARIETPDGERLLIERDARGRIAAIQDAAGRALRLAYTGDRLASLRLPGGLRIRYDYDPHGVLVAVRYPDGRRVRYHYEDLQAFHLLTGIEQPDGRRSRYQYDELRRVVASAPRDGSPVEALALRWLLPTEPGGTGQTVVEENGRLSTWQWRVDPDTAETALLSVSGEPCRSCPVLADQNPGSEKNHSDKIKRILTYDNFGLPAEALLSGLRSFSGLPPEPIDLHLRWHRHAGGALAGKLASVERLASDGRVARTVFRHDGSRRLVAIERPEGLVERIGRDALGRATLRVGADRVRHETRIDRFWRPTLVRAGDRGARVAWNPDGLPVAIDWFGGESWTLAWDAGRVSLRSNRGWLAWTDGERADPMPINSQGGVAVAIAAVADGAATDRAAKDGTATDGAAADPAVAANVLAPERSLIDAAGRRTDFRYDDLGRLIEESSTDAGWRRYRHDAFGQVERIESAVGLVEIRRHDLAGRLVEREQQGGGEHLLTRFEWRAGLLALIDHPRQKTSIDHDQDGRIVAITDEIDGAAHRWRFIRDRHGRLASQGLPGGAWLDYRYDKQGRAVAMSFRAPGAEPVPVVQDVRHRGGRVAAWRFGNGTRFERHDDAAGRPLEWRWLAAGAEPDPALPAWRYRWRSDGLLAGMARMSATSIVHERRLGWDALGRLIVDERHAGGEPVREFFAWDLAGALRLARGRDGSGWRADRDEAVRDPDGRSLLHRGLALRRGATGRIAELRQADRVLARYAYNAAGERIERDNQDGRIGFLYRGRALAAETGVDGRVRRHYLRWQGVPVAIVDVGAAGPVFSWLHGDHLGTPHAATDSAGRVVWQGDYLAFGRLASGQGSLRQPLRLAGQYHDPESGLHDNYQRSYDPELARYLEPDPLGLAGGLNRFAYADGDPVTASDPLGLILFAFDGTNNAAAPPGQDDQSNVRKFFELYDDGAKWYMTGVGLDDPDSGIRTNARDPLDANTARARVDYMLGTLDAHLAGRPAGDTVSIDVVGFSRGAAMARDFANRVARLDFRDAWADRGLCLDLRFLGLWDTVAQFGLNGSDNHRWLLGIPGAAGAVYHAVALNEHRSLFPLEGARGQAVIERGFIGSHADVGGGNAEGDLSDISLAWMVRMAGQAGLKMQVLPEKWRRIDAPILHDRNYDAIGDRRVHVRDAIGRVVAAGRQRRMPIAGMDWAGSQPFLIVPPQRERDAYGQLSIVGSVDLAAYLAWLAEHYSLALEMP